MRYLCRETPPFCTSRSNDHVLPLHQVLFFTYYPVARDVLMIFFPLHRHSSSLALVSAGYLTFSCNRNTIPLPRQNGDSFLFACKQFHEGCSASASGVANRPSREDWTLPWPKSTTLPFFHLLFQFSHGGPPIPPPLSFHHRVFFPRCARYSLSLAHISAGNSFPVKISYEIRTSPSSHNCPLRPRCSLGGLSLLARSLQLTS